MIKAHYDTDFGANKTLIKGNKGGAFGEAYSREIYSGVNGKGHRKSWKEFSYLKTVDSKYYCSNYYELASIYMALNVEYP